MLFRSVEIVAAQSSVIKDEGSKETKNSDVSGEGKTESKLEGNEDFEPVSILTRSGAPIPMKFIPFRDGLPARDDKEYEDTNDIPHLTRRRSPRKPPYTLGEPYPIPQLRPLYWKPGAPETVSARAGARKRKWEHHSKMCLPGLVQRPARIFYLNNIFQIAISGYKGKKPRMVPTSATAVLNEKYPGLQYAFSDPVGPPHALTFTVTVNFPVRLVF